MVSTGRSGTRKSRQREPLDEEGLFAYAVASLARRMRSVRDLRRLMRMRAEPGDAGEQAMNAVVRRLEELRYLSDERFAADFTRLRKEGQGLGRRRVAQDLLTKGIAKPLAQSALAEAYEGTDEVELARSYCQRKRMAAPANEKETARLVGRLQRAGFGSDAIWKLLRSWKLPVEEVELEEREQEL